ncbi:MAG: TetR family transcriptional regulator [Candidatus Dadabacteria bacterium]|nr:TetR family transcriptional regulator [Candidatus Dadabacteria bacterium]NIQ14835.1 TetR family transcriptional regulator [Candidatus Dadabacteria bacterium]
MKQLKVRSKDTSARLNARSKKFERHNEIISAATDLFSDKSYHDVTMDDIAEEVGVAKGTIYLYFSSKEKLYLEILENSFEAIESLLQDEVEKNDSAPEKLKKILTIIFSFYRKNKNVLKILGRDETHLIREHYELTERWRLNRIKLYEKIIQKGITEGTFIDQNPKLRALMLYGAVGAVMTFYDFSKSPKIVSDEVFSQLSSGLLINNLN